METSSTERLTAAALAAAQMADTAIPKDEKGPTPVKPNASSRGEVPDFIEGINSRRRSL